MLQQSISGKEVRSKGSVEAEHFGGFRYDRPQNLDAALLNASTLASTPSSMVTWRRIWYKGRRRCE